MIKAVGTLDPLVRVAQVMAVDRVTAEVVSAMAAAGVPSLLLKGPALAHWLYPEGGRYYGDTDLLVDPDDSVLAIEVLAELGFSDWLEGASPLERSPHATTYVRSQASGWVACVDLHRGLGLVEAPPVTQWAVLGEGAETTVVTGVSVAILGVAARAFHVALHVVQHGVSVEQPLEDLRRCLTVLGLEDWRAASRVAESLGATQALSAGLRVLPEGVVVADAIGLEAVLSPALRVLLASRDQSRAVRLQQLVDADSASRRLAIAARTAFPTATSMRARFQLENPGGRGWLIGAYLRRLVATAWRLGPALAARRAALREP